MNRRGGGGGEQHQSGHDLQGSFILGQIREAFPQRSIAHLIMVLQKRDEGCWWQMAALFPPFAVLPIGGFLPLVGEPFGQ
ncbi:hypothetical protein ACQZV8_19590 [Magnetococcales bacterium HHB-1]